MRPPRTRLVAVEVPATIDLRPALARATRVVVDHLHLRQRWKRQPVAEHVQHARDHLHAWQRGDTSEEQLAHALVRVMFAILVDQEPPR